MKKQIYIICLTIFCGLLIVGCSSDNLGEQDNIVNELNNKGMKIIK